MDGTTEPIIAVIGHPIAGNPSQFAIERSLEALALDWRVLSLDVRPADVAAALEGFRVTGIAGVMIDRSVMPMAADWVSKQDDDSSSIPGPDPLAGVPSVPSDPSVPSVPSVPPEPNQADQVPPVLAAIDCLSCQSSRVFEATFQQRLWIDQQMTLAGDPETRLWIGGDQVGLPIDRSGFQKAEPAGWPDFDAIAGAGLIVISDPETAVPLADDQGAANAASGPEIHPASNPLALESDDWPTDDGSTLVIDLTDGHPEMTTLADRGYRCVTAQDRLVGTLAMCVKCWTGRQVPTEVIVEAIEEYTGV